ncbi:helix-turn-helix domain-containing protein [Streptomyces sp. NPDC059900]|uniref:helix-turn-helix domain-containing protein n=1 Tax=Streptomyces sp. NPDC059900 TaxID=3155816 RepID=UPI00342404A1
MDNKAALRQLLRWKRQQVDPSSLGWPPRTGRGRRSPGLSQAQVGQLLFVSERTYAQLERGEMPAPTPEFLDRVSVVLGLQERERIALYVYSVGHEPPHPQDPLAGTNVHPAWKVAVEAIKGQPCYVNDVAWNVLAYNDDFLDMFPRPRGAEPALPERNLIRYMLLREDVREHHMVNWETQWAIPLTAQLRTAVAAHPENADLQQLDQEVDADPVVRPLYRDRHVAYVHPNGDTRKMRYHGYGGPDGEAYLDQCCDRHAPSRVGDVTMCTAMPLGSPGARFTTLVFRPDPARTRSAAAGD